LEIPGEVNANAERQSNGLGEPLRWARYKLFPRAKSWGRDTDRKLPQGRKGGARGDASGKAVGEGDHDPGPGGEEGDRAHRHDAEGDRPCGGIVNGIRKGEELLHSINPSEEVEFSLPGEPDGGEGANGHNDHPHGGRGQSLEQ